MMTMIKKLFGGSTPSKPDKYYVPNDATPRCPSGKCKCRAAADVERMKQEATEIIRSREKERIITDDEIRYNAYLFASADGFTKTPEEYWTQAEKHCKGSNPQ